MSDFTSLSLAVASHRVIGAAVSEIIANVAVIPFKWHTNASLLELDPFRFPGISVFRRFNFPSILGRTENL